MIGVVRLWSGLAVITATAVAMAACGGGSSGPGPLRHTLDNQYIVGISPAEQGGVVAAEQDLIVATKEKDKAEYDLKNVGLEVKIAGFEYDRAKLSVKIAQAKREAAASAGVAMQNLADSEMRAATLGMTSAETKREFMKSKGRWLKAWRKYTIYGVYAADAKLQLEKARIAKAKNNYPKGFDLAKFEEQARDRVGSAGRAKEAAQDELKRAQGLQREWARREQEWMSAMGLKGVPESSSAELDKPAEPVRSSEPPAITPTPGLAPTPPTPAPVPEGASSSGSTP